MQQRKIFTCNLRFLFIIEILIKKTEKLEVNKKIEKPIKPKNWLNRENRKKITEKTEPWKKLIKPIIILKKPTGLVWFRFYKPKTEKTKPNPNRKKPEKNQVKPSQIKKIESNQAKPKNQAKPEKTESKQSQNRAKSSQNQVKLKKPSQTGLNRFLC